MERVAEVVQHGEPFHSLRGFSQPLSPVDQPQPRRRIDAAFDASRRGHRVVGVWVVNLVTFYLTRWVNPALGLLAIYLTITNAAAHVLFAIMQRRNHPRLPTAILALTPCGIWALMATPGPFVTAADHVGAATFATLLRAAIGAWVRLVSLNSRSHQGSV